jgi:glycosyltransferase involved in cell wall biosynthesis
VTKKILYISDVDWSGSGYATLAIPILTGLANLGYEIKVCGLNYAGQEHTYPFSIIPVGSPQDALALAGNINILWKPDIFMVALDIPLQHFFFDNLKKLGKKYICITPLENGPLTLSWSAYLLGMDALFFISELGKQEAIKSGIKNAEHLQIGIDCNQWRPPTAEERATLRKGLGIGEDDFVILTVADNQERKNLSAGVEAVSIAKKQIKRQIKYILVTRKDSPFGWKFPDLPLFYGVQKEVQLYERGLPQKDLWGLYAVSDVYLSTSKAEGLGLPVLDAMACGVPVIATDTGALRELLDEDRGMLITTAFKFLDVWGNEFREMPSVEHASALLCGIAEHKPDTQKALEYVQDRTWTKTVEQLDKKIEDLYATK